MALHAGLRRRLEEGGALAGVVRLLPDVAGDAVHPGEVHRAGGLGDPDPSLPEEHQLLEVVLGDVAGLAVRLAGGVGGHALDLVLDGLVAADARHVLARHVLVVEPGGVLEPLQVLGLVVAVEAAVRRRLALALEGVQVAALARDAPGRHVVLVVVGDVAHLDGPVGGEMALLAAAQGLEAARVLLALQVAEEAGGLGHHHVGADHDLAVAGGAAQLLPGPALAQVLAVVEADEILVGEVALEEARGVAVGAEAAAVLYLGEGLGAVGAGDELGHLGEGLELDAQGVTVAGRVVAVDAGDEVVLRGGPGLVVGLHDVAGAAERGAGAVLVEAAEA